LYQSSQARFARRGLMRPSVSQVRNQSIMEDHKARAAVKHIKDCTMEGIVISNISNNTIEGTTERMAIYRAQIIYASAGFLQRLAQSTAHLTPEYRDLMVSR
jgi:hypothetical protein